MLPSGLAQQLQNARCGGNEEGACGQSRVRTKTFDKKRTNLLSLINVVAPTEKAVLDPPSAIFFRHNKTDGSDSQARSASPEIHSESSNHPKTNSYFPQGSKP